MFSPLAFDKQAKPITFHRRTKLLRVRLFRNPAARGTCSQVLDDDGQPLYVDAEIDYPEFRQLVGNVPGLYRLDQCDDDGSAIEDAPPAYVTIYPPRNTANGGTGDLTAIAIIRDMAATQSDALKEITKHLEGLANGHAKLLESAAEMMRAPNRPAPAPIPTELRNAGDDDDQDDDEYESDEELEDADVIEPQAPSRSLAVIAQMANMIDPKQARQIGQWLWEKFVQFRRETAAQVAQPVVSPAPMQVVTAPVHVAPAAANAAPVPVNGAAVPMNAAPATAAPVAPPMPAPAAPPAVPSSDAVHAAAPVSSAVIATSAPVTSSTDASVPASPTPAASFAPATPEAAAPNIASAAAQTEQPVSSVPQLTQEQLAKVTAINAQLTPTEQLIAQQVMMCMDPTSMQHWLIELSAMSVEDALATVRMLIAEVQQQQQPRRAKAAR